MSDMSVTSLAGGASMSTSVPQSTKRIRISPATAPMSISIWRNSPSSVSHSS